ncbi:conserved virulence factor C family protein [Niallia nealsonii]|uniref:Virulence factor n=1 Tax=Niallia nealsonii TaxID=115979 RepID=A0A2N0Z3G2_9BACI|nr:conserved virulence factor C family protein [Niallia nealsonii]PKG24048.1 virulence factor [Niallia nealsonii]
MRIISIEPTPSPNTMKINLDEELPMGKSNNYKQGNAADAPEIIQTILEIEGIKGVYHVADFLAVERNARYDWKELLTYVRNAFGEETEAAQESKINEHYGEIKVLVQMYKGIPMQVKLSDGEEERRFGLPEIFLKAVTEAKMPNDNVVVSRKWKEFGVRYGEFEEIGNAVVEELLAAYPENRLEALVQQAKNEEDGENAIKPQRQKIKLSLEDLDHPDWKVRYQKLEQTDDPTLEDIPVLSKALLDEKPSIRRLATVYLGMIEDKLVLESLYVALKDKTVTVRRTAGDCLSDLGFPEAMPEMMEALKDKSKLVRWRAAMYLYEVGDETTLPALKAHENDPEFEVSLQIKLAIERIELGEEAKGSVWKQMTEARK